MKQHKKKLHISKVKRNNQIKNKLSKHGKLKCGQNKKVLRNLPAEQRPALEQEDDTESDGAEGMLQMVEQEDLAFLNKAVSERSYSLLKNIWFRKSDENFKWKRKRGEGEDQLETQYEDDILSEDGNNKKLRHLLPIKTAEGLVKRTIEEDEKENVSATGPMEQQKAQVKKEDDKKMVFEEEAQDVNKPVSIAQLFACREEVLQQRKFAIGSLSSGILENPELKSKNFLHLFELMEEKNPEVEITVRKLATLSVLEVFKDVLPGYQIKIYSNTGVKLKKETKALQEYEKGILKHYKQYLQKLENMLSMLKRKKGDTQALKESQQKLGELALHCLCDLLVANPYFNFSRNLVQLLVPYLDSPISSVRQMSASSFKSLLQADKRGEISLEVVRKINYLVKKRTDNVHQEVLDVLLVLRIKDINLDKEKEQELKKKQFMTHRQKLLNMSRRERKKSKKLAEMDKELLETKAEENKQTKHKFFTEVTKIVFTIYFRILKEAPSSRLMSSVLEGLAKFSHCINVDFFHDLVQVLNSLVEQSSLGYREQLHCVQSVFTILSGQGDALNIDPLRFYSHLYRNLFHVHAGTTHSDALIVLCTLDSVLVKRRKKISQQRLLAFTKRLATLSLQLLHNGSLTCLSIVKMVLQAHKSADILLDPDSSVGESSFFPEMEEPEYCNAGSTALWELQALQRHYHPVVRKFSRHITLGVPATEKGILPPELAKKTAEELFQEFDPSDVVFRPSVPVPQKVEAKDRKGGFMFRNCVFEHCVTNKLHSNSSVVW